MNVTHNRLSPPRWRAAYQTCDACGFQFWQEKQEQQRCRLCSASMAMPWANGQEQRRTMNTRQCDVCKKAYTPNSPNAKFCSPECRRKHDTEAQREAYRKQAGLAERTVTCPECETVFTTFDSRQVTCGEKCKNRRRARRKRERQNLAAMMAAASARKEQAA